MTALAGLKGDLSGRYYSLGDMTEKEQQQLIDVRFNLHLYKEKSWLPKFLWPFINHNWGILNILILLWHQLQAGLTLCTVSALTLSAPFFFDGAYFSVIFISDAFEQSCQVQSLQENVM